MSPCVARCDSTRSAARLLAPITLVGLTALSVLIITKRSAPLSMAASAAWCVPNVLFCSAAQALSSSISGTCLNAAAWNTSCGPVRQESGSQMGQILHVTHQPHQRQAGVPIR